LADLVAEEMLVVFNPLTVRPFMGYASLAVYFQEDRLKCG